MSFEPNLSSKGSRSLPTNTLAMPTRSAVNHLDQLPGVVLTSPPRPENSVSIIVPCRNEIKAIDSFLTSLLEQDLNGLDWEVLIADGMSDDGTREKLERFCEKNPRIRLIDNPSRIVSTGLNAAIRVARGDVILRMDVHTEYQADYIERCVRVLGKTGAQNVGGACIAEGRGYVGRAIAAAFQSRFAVGGARWHQPNHEGPVDTVHLGCWRRDVFRRIGLFDETLVRNQDDELNLRLLRQGGRIWQSPQIVSWYHPRSSLGALFRQYSQYGFWKVAVIKKHRLPASWRHVVPGAFVIANFVFLAAVVLSHGVGHGPLRLLTTLGAGMDIVYAFAIVVATFAAARKNGWTLLAALPTVFVTYHLAYGFGFLAGILYFLIKPRNVSDRDGVFQALTR
jgi:glycosyltransferase involved in cell wall biosynthesis